VGNETIFSSHTMPRLTTDYGKNYCNWTLIVKVIVDKKYFRL